MVRAVLAVLVIAWLPAALNAQQQGDASIRVRVTDATTQEPIANAQVVLPDLYRFWMTDANGIASVTEIPEGSQRVEVTAEGYEADRLEIEVEAAADGRVDIALVPQPPDDVRGRISIRPISNSGQGGASLDVHVTDAQSGEPLVGAIISIPDQYRTWRTDADGTASLTDLQPGTHQLEVTMFAYAPARVPLRVEPGAVAEADVEMETQALAIPGVSVTVRGMGSRSPSLELHGFYDRQRYGGVHLDRVAIHEYNPYRPTDVLLRIPGVGITWQMEGGITPELVIYSRRNSVLADNNPVCPMTVYVDGTEWGGPVDDIPIEWLEGMEVYLGASQLPPRFAGSGCGVVLLWTG